MIDNRILQLLVAKGIGDVTIRKFFSHIEKYNYTIDQAFSSTSFFHEIGFRANVIDDIFSSSTVEKAHKLALELESENIKMITLLDSDYPKHLKKSLPNDCPPILFAKGNLSLLNKASVGFCGSRKASNKGLSIAADCARQLAEKDIVVVSGYASGADLAAHGSALRNSGSTVFVLAEGILRSTIKNEIKNLIDFDNHIFISQFSPTVTWNAGNAMKRNSVIIGLSQAMILVESGKTGGTFAAGEEALNTGCPLFVIDFAKPEVSAEANPYFIQAGGYPIRGKGGIPNLDKVFTVVEARNAELLNAIQTSRSHDRLSFEQIKLDI